MKKKYILIGWVFLFFIDHLIAQDFTRLEVEVRKDSMDVLNPFAGGLNAPQFSSVDLNNDGVLDLYVFDKAGDIHLTFLNNGSPNEMAYRFAPEFLSNFPEIRSWVLLRDYNGDNVMDIFCYSDQPGIDGVVVFTGKYVNEKITFERFDHSAATEYLLAYANSMGNEERILISKLDYPSIDDIDGDGDLDILTFDMSGTTVEMYRNYAVEWGLGLDSLKFELYDDCWGKFKEANTNAGIFLGSNSSICPTFTNSQVELRHAGSTLLSIDLDNDQDKELILGDISSSKLIQLENGGTTQNAFMVDFDADFPSYDTTANFPLFLATFFLDVDNDEVKDLLVSPNNISNPEDSKNVWFYKNQNNNEFPEFDFQQNNFLVSTMLDMGTGARPTFADVNADGLMDFVVGNTTFYVDGNFKNARLFLFENIGTATAPKFELVDDDYLNLKQYNLPYSYFNYSPAFGDLDNDGDIDLVVGEDTGKIIFLQNMAGAGNPFDFAFPDLQYQIIDAGEGINPQIIDVNRDGLSDLLVGRRLGRLVYFPNQGMVGAPDFEPDPFTLPNNPTFGNVDTRPNNLMGDGSCSPMLVDEDGAYILYCGTEEGRIEVYENIDGNLEGDFILVDSTFGNIREGKVTHIAFAELNDDEKSEILIGNSRGGLGLYSMEEVVSTENEIPANSLTVHLLSNPAKDYFYFEILNFLEKESSLRLYDAVGKLVFSKNIYKPKDNIDIRRFSSGLYFCEFMVGNQRVVKKLLIL